TPHYSMELDVLEGKPSALLDRAWQRVEHQLADLRATAAVSRFSVGIIVLPCREQVLGQFPHARYQTRVREIADRLGFFVVDPLPVLVASTTKKDALFVPYDRNHPSAAGHRVIAQTIVESFDRRGVLAGASLHADRGEF